MEEGWKKRRMEEGREEGKGGGKKIDGRRMDGERMEGRKERTMEGRRKDRRVEEGGMEHTSQHPEAMEDPTSAGTQCCCAAAPPPHLHAGTQHCCWALQMWVSCAALAPPGPNCAAADRTQWVKRPHSPHPHVPISPPPHVPMSQHPPIPISPHPHIPTSPHPHAPQAQPWGYQALQPLRVGVEVPGGCR